MTILGLGDGHNAGAALVVDGAITCVAPGAPGPGLPHGAIDAVLADAGVRPAEVDVVALAGRFSPPLVVRRYPGLGDLSATSTARGVAAVWQTTLRATGLGALQADRAADWLARQLHPRGFRPRKVLTVDWHTCLASAAYRCQDDDGATVVTVHPHGDGLLAAVHRGVAGQLDRVWEQRAVPALHTHLERCARAVGLPPSARLGAFDDLAGTTLADPDLVALLGPALEGGKLVGGVTAPAFEELAGAPPEVGAASIAWALRTALAAFVSAHVGTGDSVAVGGAWLSDPTTVTWLGGAVPVGRLACGPDVGAATPALGAALFEAGSPPVAVPATLGPRRSDTELRLLLQDAGIPEHRLRRDRLAGLLATGGVVGRLAGRAGNGALGTRSILFRADDDRAFARARSVAAGPARGHLLAAPPPWLGRLTPALTHGMAVDGGVRVAVVDPEHDPDLFVLAETCPGGLGALALPDDPAAALAHLRGGLLDGVVLGPYQVLAA